MNSDGIQQSDEHRTPAAGGLRTLHDRLKRPVVVVFMLIGLGMIMAWQVVETVLRPFYRRWR